MPWLILGGVAILAVALWLRLGSSGRDQVRHSTRADTSGEETAQSGGRRPTSDGRTEQRSGSTPAARTTNRKPADSFLDAFAGEKAAESESPAKALTNKELERKLSVLLATKDRLKELAVQAKAWKGAAPRDQVQAALDEREKLLERLNTDAASLEKELARVRKDRPADAVPAWLTGELLILVGGEPEEILPHLERAVQGGLERPRVFASLARALTEANRLPEAFGAAKKALDLDGQDRYAWETFTRTAFHIERFADVSARLSRAFPGAPPAWAQVMGKEAAVRQARWEKEQTLRRAEQKADNLPRVRLVIEHRQFARRPGKKTGQVESTGRGEVVLELFEDQAPQTVANFLDLVERKVYDGTRFYLAEPAALVAGGDPGSRTGEPADDGTGGPGYVIPDEFGRPDARRHFRGSLSMVNQGPHTAGSAFFVTFVPMPEMDGRYTVFGRVVQGQEVVDRITLGRTNREVGHFGRIIPGDLLLRAEVLRKRPHAYRVVKEPVK